MRFKHATFRLSEVAYIKVFELDHLEDRHADVSQIWCLSIVFRGNTPPLIFECGSLRDEVEQYRGAIESELGFYQSELPSMESSTEAKLEVIRGQCCMAGCDNPRHGEHHACLDCMKQLEDTGAVGREGDV